MGHDTTLSNRQKAPFRVALTQLRVTLNDEDTFEDLVKRGVREIFIIHDVIEQHRHRRVFNRKMYAQWMRGHPELEIQPKTAFINYAVEPGERMWEVRQNLTILRDAVNNPEKFEQLVGIGPCSNYIWSPDDQPNVEGFPSLLIHNFVPSCHPNTDYSLKPEGLWYHS